MPEYATPTRTAVRPIPTPRAAVDRGPRIVVGTDSSRWGRLAVHWAAAHAWLAKATLELVGGPEPESESDPRLDLAREFPALPVISRRTADTVTGLVDAAAGAELVVLGRRGHQHGGDGLGSNVLPVAEQARCDVLVVGGRMTAIHGDHRWISVVLGSAADPFALRSAARLAALRSARLRILYGPAWSDRRAPTQPIDRCLSVLRQAARLVSDVEPTVPTVTELMSADPKADIARPDHTDVLVVGVGRRLNPLALAALERAESPVLVAHPKTTRSGITLPAARSAQ